MILAVFRTVEANGSIMSSEDFDGIERLVKEVLYNLEKLVKSWKVLIFVIEFDFDFIELYICLPNLRNISL